MPASGGVVVATPTFSTAPDVNLAFEPDSLILKATAGTVDLSFDGIDVHLTLASGDSILSVQTKRKRLWVRQNGGAATLRWSALTVV